MTRSFSKSVGGYEFELVSDSWALNEAFIMVPVAAAESLDSETLGHYVRSLIEDAWLAKAMSMADWFTSHKKELPRYILEEHPSEVALVERFAGRSPEIDRAIELISAAKTRARHRAAAPQKRREISGNYDRFFIAVGRRDGFRCAHCGEATNDLQIDHIVAVINGGGNELENLQLLCSKCNSVKRDR